MDTEELKPTKLIDLIDYRTKQSMKLIERRYRITMILLSVIILLSIVNMYLELIGTLPTNTAILVQVVLFISIIPLTYNNS